MVPTNNIVTNACSADDDFALKEKRAGEEDDGDSEGYERYHNTECGEDLQWHLRMGKDRVNGQPEQLADGVGRPSRS